MNVIYDREQALIINVEVSSFAECPHCSHRVVLYFDGFLGEFTLRNVPFM